MQWLTTSDFVLLLKEHYPISKSKVREWCEEGLIPPEFAKRSISSKERGHWRISSKGLLQILDKILQLSPQEIDEIQSKIKRSQLQFSEKTDRKL